MKFVKPRAEIITPVNRDMIIAHLETIGRTCYQSEPKGDPGSFVRGLVKRGHEAIIEHYSLSVRFIVDRGISHEIVRHRVASFAQESTRYCNYKGGVGFIIPPWVNMPEGDFNPIWDGCLGRHEVDPFEEGSEESWWFWHCAVAERDYLKLLAKGQTPQQARAVLPNSLKTELIMTANLREWRHFFKLRAFGTTGKPHPQMVEVALPLFREMKQLLPEIFFDMEEPNNG